MSYMGGISARQASERLRAFLDGGGFPPAMSTVVYRHPILNGIVEPYYEPRGPRTMECKLGLHAACDIAQDGQLLAGADCATVFTCACDHHLPQPTGVIHV